MLTYIDISAASQGISPNLSFALVAIANASSGIGRCGCGLLSDKLGEFLWSSPFLKRVSLGS